MLLSLKKPSTLREGAGAGAGHGPRLALGGSGRVSVLRPGQAGAGRDPAGAGQSRQAAALLETAPWLRGPHVLLVLPVPIRNLHDRAPLEVALTERKKKEGEREGKKNNSQQNHSK